MNELRHIKIKIADQQPFELDIPADRKAATEKVARDVNRVWAKWCENFPGKSHQDILAMVAFQYARYYYDLLDKIQQSEKVITDFERRLDDILLDVE